MKRIKDFLKKLRFFIRNAWSWRKLLWSDRDWDHEFLYIVLEFKLRKMAKYQKKYGLSEFSSKIHEELIFAADLLKKIRENEYFDKFSKDHRSYWGDMKFETNSEGALVVYTDRARKEGREEEETKERKNLLKKSNQDRENDISDFFSFVREKHSEWWD